MKYLLKFLIVLLVSLSSFSLVFSAPGLVCCYDGNTGSIFPELDCSNLGSEAIELGPQNPGSQVCEDYLEERVSCQVGSICYDFVDGKKIYESVVSYVPAGSCDSFPPYSEGACQASSAQGSTGTSGSGTAGSGTETSYEQDIGDAFWGLDEVLTTGEDQILCSDAGGLFGYFNNKDACEAIELIGENFCVYNPYLSGKLVSGFSDFDTLGLFDKEKSCVVNTFIQECHDYSTKDNCNGNVANLNDSCQWKKSTIYSEDFSDDVLGICVSKKVSALKYFDQENIFARQNLLKNPSFELDFSTGGWSFGGQSNRVTNVFAPSGSKTFILYEGDSLSQTVNFIDSKTTYESSFNFRILNVTGSSGLVTFKFGDVEKTFSFNEVSNYFSRFTFSNIADFDVSFINLSIEVSGGLVELDDISFEAITGSSGVSLDGSNIFKPVEVISSDASNCGLCYDNKNLNMCTPSKSEILGDCSYMVEGVEFPYGNNIAPDYLGVQGNGYLDNEFRWESQSLANSLLFCEMYTIESQCIDPNNYINEKYAPYHLSSGSSLCKWDDDDGCFKDSNGDSLPDTRLGWPYMSKRTNYHNAIYIRNLAQIVEPLPDFVKNSDFELSCDSLPPNVYIYFQGVNSSKDVVTITDQSTEGLIGDVKFGISVSDAPVEACKDYDINKKIYFDYVVNGQTKFTYIETSIHDIVNRDAKDYFVDDSGVSMFKDGEENIIDISITDQSGNLGKTWSFKMDVDLFGPNVTILSPTPGYGGSNLGIIGPKSSLNFSVSDVSGVESCSYEMVPLNSVDSSYYENGTGEFNISGLDSKDFEINFKLPILNSSENGDYYSFTVDCVDIFGQSEEPSAYFFLADFNTNLKLIEPNKFFRYTDYDGFLNEKTNVTLITSEIGFDGDSCELDFPGLTSDSNIATVEDFDPADFSELSGSYDLSVFESVITGTIDFTTDGRYEGAYVCTDSEGNTARRSVVYYYDTLKPLMQDYTLVGTDSSVYTAPDGKQYLRKDHTSIDDRHNALVDFEIDGSGSWISDEGFDISFTDVNGDVQPLNDYFIYTSIVNDSMVGNLSLDLTVDGLIYGGLDLGDSGLREFEFDIDYYDKAGNANTNSFVYYYDPSVPRLLMSGGDVVDLYLADQLVFTSAANPEFNISLSTPSYREFACKVTAYNPSGQANIKEYSSVLTALNFKLGDVLTSLKFGVDKPIRVVVDCEDFYGVSVDETYDLHYDDEPPILSYAGLANGNELFSLIQTDYPDYTDKLALSFEDTNEKGGYTCSYELVGVSNYYDCNTSSYDLYWFDSMVYESGSNVPLFSKGKPGSETSSDFICYRNNRFVIDELNHAVVNDNLRTDVEVEVTCLDGVGLSTSKSFVVDYDYVSGSLVSFEFDYVDSKAYPVVRSIANYPRIAISLSRDGTNSFMDLTNSYSDNGVYIYESTSGIDLSNFAEGVNVVYAVAFDGASVDTVLQSNLIVDKDFPVVNLRIPDMNEEFIYSENFELIFEATDEGSGLSNIQILESGSKIFEHNYDSQVGVDFFNENMVTLSDSFNFFSSSESSYNGRFAFGPATLDTTYEFEFIATDKGGNKINQFLTVTYKDGIAITLVESDSAKVDGSGFVWVTRTGRPTLKFETNKEAESCMVYPDFDNRPELSVDSGSGSDFTVDLSGVSGFDLTSFESKSSVVMIECSKAGETYTYYRNLFYNDLLPDYVIASSSNNFVLSGTDLTTVINVKSVSAFGSLTCKYGIGSVPTVPFEMEGYDSLFETIDFTGKSGVVSLNIECTDLVGNVGPTKGYDFKVLGSAPLTINPESVELSYGDLKYNLEGNTLYAPRGSDVVLSFALNRDDSVSCNYNINSVGGSFFAGTVNFFKNLFGAGEVSIESSEGFEFSTSGLEFASYDNELIIRCSVDGGTAAESFDQTYQVIYTDGALDLDVSRVAIQ